VDIYDDRLLLLKENPSLTQVELSEMMDRSRRTGKTSVRRLGSFKNQNNPLPFSDFSNQKRTRGYFSFVIYVYFFGVK
jgi:hypothetical protein